MSKEVLSEVLISASTVRALNLDLALADNRIIRKITRAYWNYVNIDVFEAGKIVKPQQEQKE